MNSIRLLVLTRAVAVAAAATLAGCATLPADGGTGRMVEPAGSSPQGQRVLEDAKTARARAAELLNAPLTAETAEELALLVVPVNFELERRSSGRGRLEVAIDTAAIGGEARRAYFRAVASEELAAYAEQAKAAADASSELADRMLRAGNFSKFARMRQQAFYADATARLVHARQQALADRERLTRALGLEDADAFTLPGRLPGLPGSAIDWQDVKPAAERAVELRSQIRESYSAYRARYDLAKHYREEILPLRQRISEEQLLRYNGMLISVFDLLDDAYEQIGVVTAAIEVLRDFWLADTELHMAMAGRWASSRTFVPSAGEPTADFGRVSHSAGTR